MLKGIKLYCDSAASKSELFSRETDDNCVPSDSELQQLMVCNVLGSFFLFFLFFLFCHSFSQWI